MSLPANICIGTYDGSVAGMHLDEDAADGALTLTTKFAYNSHPSAVRSCALHAHTLATGGADEVVRLYDLRRRQELGSLHHHSGTISALALAQDGARALLFCASADTSISLWRAPSAGPGASDWTLLKALAAHRAPVAALAVHPSLKVLLSTSQDRALYLWNLARGKVAFSVKTKAAHAHAVAWAPSGDRYALAAARSATVSDVSGRDVSSFTHEARVGVARFLTPENGALDGQTLLTGADDGVVRRWDMRVPTKDEAKKEDGDDGDAAVAAFKLPARVIDLHAVGNLVVAADARGALRIWDVRRGGEPRIETTVGSRGVSLTCMSAAPTVFTPSPLGASPGEADTEEAETEAEPQKTGAKEEDGAKKKGRALEGTASQRKRKKSKLRK